MLEAAKVYALANLSMKAVSILGERGLVDDRFFIYHYANYLFYFYHNIVVDIVRSQKMDELSLTKAAEYFIKFRAHSYARETYLKMVLLF
jgi:hypothetical protein